MRGGSEVGSLFFRLQAVESSKSDEIVDGRPRSALPVGIKLFADKTGVVGPFLGLEGLFERSEEHTSELQSHLNLVCRLLLEKKKKNKSNMIPVYKWPTK